MNHTFVPLFFLGLKFQNENEEELKDKMDFPKREYQHYPPGGKYQFLYNYNFNKVQ